MICQQLARRPLVFVGRLLALSALAICLALPVQAQAKARPATWHSAWRPGWLPGDPEAAAGPGTLAPIWAPRSASTPGLFIALDPITHLPTAPSEAQRRAFAAQLAHDALLAPTRPLQVQRLPGGGEIIHLNGQFQSYSIARRTADGRIVTDCAPDAATARKLLKQPAPPPRTTAMEEK